MRRAVQGLFGSNRVRAATAILSLFALPPSEAWAQGTNFDIAPVDVTAKRQQKPAVKRPTKPVAARPAAAKPSAARQMPRSPAKVAAAAPKRVASQAKPPAPEPKPTPSAPAPANGATPRGVAPAFAGGQVASAGRLGILGNTDIKKAPFSIASYTDKFFRDQQATTITQGLVLDPSVRAEQSRGGTVDAFVIRGFPFNEGNVGEFGFDGLYGIAPNSRIFTDYAERIEVLRGPSASISGVAPNGAIGGVINIVPKRALPEDLTRVTSSFGSVANGGVQADISRRYGAFREWGIRFAGNLHAGDTPFDKQKEQTKVGSLSVDYQGDRFRGWAYLLGQTDFFRAPERPFLALTSPTPIMIPNAPNGQLNISQPWEYSRQYDQGGLLKFEYDIASNVTAFADIGGALGTVNRFFGNPTLVSSTGDITNTPSFFDQNIRRYTYDGGLRAAFDTAFIHHAFVLQDSYYHDDVNRLLNAGTTYTSNIFAPVFQPVQMPNTVGPRAKLNQDRLVGLSLVDTLSALREHILLTVGVRRQEVYTNNYLANVGTLTSSVDRYAITPLVGLTVRPNDVISFYGNYTEGLSRGDVAPNAASNSGTVLDPYISRQYEAGVKGQISGFGASVAGFQITKALGELSTVTGATMPIFSATGEERVRGIEYNIYGELSHNVRVLGGTTFLQGTLTRTALSTNIGNNAIGVPHIQTNIGGELDLPWITPGLTVTGIVVYTGSQFADTANVQPISSYARLDLGARYTTFIDARRTTFRFNVQNVTNTHYYNSVASFGTFFIGDPRTFLGSITVDL